MLNTPHNPHALQTEGHFELYPNVAGIASIQHLVYFSYTFSISCANVRKRQKPKPFLPDSGIKWLKDYDMNLRGDN